MPPIREWESFYVIVGTSAAALTGLQFVVVVLAAEMGALRPGATRAFATPTIVHFSAVLLISALVTAPWHALHTLRVCLAVSSVVGLLYTMIVVRHARGQTHYTPVLEDWLWHAIFPAGAYAVLLVAALIPESREAAALFLAGGVALVLLFTGIHNAWDSVTYIALRSSEERQRPGGGLTQ